jgi:hypothetical protein
MIPFPRCLCIRALVTVSHDTFPSFKPREGGAPRCATVLRSAPHRHMLPPADASGAERVQRDARAARRSTAVLGLATERLASVQAALHAMPPRGKPRLGRA